MNIRKYMTVEEINRLESWRCLIYMAKKCNEAEEKALDVIARDDDRLKAANAKSFRHDCHHYDWVEPYTSRRVAEKKLILAQDMVRKIFAAWGKLTEERNDGE